MPGATTAAESISIRTAVTGVARHLRHRRERQGRARRQELGIGSLTSVTADGRVRPAEPRPESRNNNLHLVELSSGKTALTPHEGVAQWLGEIARTGAAVY